MVTSDPIMSNKLYRLSIAAHEASNPKFDPSWPFICVSIMFTKEAIQVLRSGLLNKKINKFRSVLTAVHYFHRACFGLLAR